VEQHSDADEGDREEKMPCHLQTSCARRAGHSNLSTRLTLLFSDQADGAAGWLLPVEQSQRAALGRT
jgi:hypothetical protein